jgi:hypothetical protein
LLSPLHAASVKTANDSRFFYAGALPFTDTPLFMSEPDIRQFRLRDDFDRAGHIALCATSIEGIRDHLREEDWKKLLKPASERNLKHKEARILVKHLIRVASESADFYRTVDFITRSAAITVENARKKNNWKPLAGHLQPSSDLTHEHMVPGEAVLLELARAPMDMRLAEVLAPLTYRALVCKKKEIQKLDKAGMKSTLPPLEQTRLAAKPGAAASIPPDFKALMRYDAAGLLDDLIPVSERAIELKKAYLAWTA